jgi:hypothetical protein
MATMADTKDDGVVATHRRSSIPTRLLAWMSVSAAIIAWCYFLDLKMPTTGTVDFFGGKLALLGLVATIATYQYGIWIQAARETLRWVRDPRWLVEEVKLENEQTAMWAGVGRADPTFIAREGDIRTWRKYRFDTSSRMLSGTLPHSEITLTNVVAGTYILMLSCVLDLAGYLLDPGGTSWRPASAGSLAGAFPPLLEAWCRYARTLGKEFESWESEFQAVKRESAAALQRRDDK